MKLTRRDALRGGLAAFASAMAARLVPACHARDSGRAIPPPPALRSRIADLGPLGEPDADGIRVAAGFRARVIARTGQEIPGTGHVWHFFPDGGAAFATEDGGWIYVSNSEVPGVGGAGAIRFDASGAIRSASRILDRTHVNCAGGRTPWHTWLSCEEIEEGRVHECDPWGEAAPIARPALGVFQHEAVAVDTERGEIYLTEDRSDGRLYRFVSHDRTSDGHPDLSSGTLEVAAVDSEMRVAWIPVPDPQAAGGMPTRLQVPASTPFNGGEGIWYHDGVVYFSTKGDWRVWAYDVRAARLRVVYDGKATVDPVLTGVDNLTVTCCGDVLVAEDGGSMEIVAILPDGSLKPVVQLVGQENSEITGPAFDPSGTRLYFSSQRAPGGGATYEIEGPFHVPA